MEKDCIRYDVYAMRFQKHFTNNSKQSLEQVLAAFFSISVCEVERIYCASAFNDDMT